VRKATRDHAGDKTGNERDKKIRPLALFHVVEGELEPRRTGLQPKTTQKKPHFGGKTGVLRKLFCTFFRVFSLFLDFLRCKPLSRNDKRRPRPSKKNRAEKPTVGFLLFAGHAKIALSMNDETLNRMGRLEREPGMIRAAAKMRKTLKSSPIYAPFAPFRGHSLGSQRNPNQRCLTMCLNAA
jgi:hypothetical protein